MFRFACTLILLATLSDLLHFRVFAGRPEQTKYQLQYAENATNVLDNMKKNYDKRLRPGFGGKPVTVYVDIYIENIGEISVKTMDYRLMIYYRQTWDDPRLAFNLHEPLTIQGGMLNDIWIPDTFFTNEKSSIFHKVTKDNYLLRIWPNGTTFLSMRISIVGICPMDLRKYPIDTQICLLDIMSYSGNTKDLILKWKFGERGSVTKASKINLPQMDLLEVNGDELVDHYSSGNFSRLSLAFKFKRRISLFLTETYVPLVVIVALSWISFWINYKVAPARVALCITTVLTMITLSSAVRTSLPKVTYTKYSDWILITGLFYVFGALVEYAVVNFCDNLETRRKAKQAEIDCEMADEGNQEEGPGGKVVNVKVPTSQRIKNLFTINVSVESIDISCRFIVPLSFFIINLIFWIYFVVDSSE